MSYSLCPLCGGQLEGYPGSPCTNPACINGRAVRDRQAPAFVAPLTGQVTRTDERTPAEARARKAQRRAAKAARRANRSRS